MRLKVLLVTVAAAVLGVGFAGSALAQLGPGTGTADKATGGLMAPALNSLGNTDHGPCVQQLLNLPALHTCKDAQGHIIMSLPGMTLVSPPEAAAKAPAKPLPKTGVNVGDFAMIGLAALAGGTVLLRRVRLAVA